MSPQLADFEYFKQVGGVTCLGPCWGEGVYPLIPRERCTHWGGGGGVGGAMCSLGGGGEGRAMCLLGMQHCQIRLKS